MKKFDFKQAKKIHSPKKVEWLKKYYKQPITEEFFVKEMKEKIKPFSNAKRKATQYSPSRLKRKYKYLKEEFGFFKN